MNSRWKSLSKVVTFVLFCGLLRTDAQTPQVKGIAHLAFRVADLELERGFFRNLGFEEAFSFTDAGKPTEIFVKINDDQFIELYPAKDANSSSGLMHVCYESDSLQDLSALYLARGLKLSQVVKGGAGNLITALHDPDGNLIEFTQYLPGSRHFEDRGKHLGPLRLSDEIQSITLPTSDLAAATQFHTRLGFERLNGNVDLRLRILNVTDEWIGFEPGGSGTKAQLVFRVSDSRQTTAELQRRGLKFTPVNHGVSVEDSEGNVFIFLESRSNANSKFVDPPR